MSVSKKIIGTIVVTVFLATGSLTVAGYLTGYNIASSTVTKIQDMIFDKGIYNAGYRVINNTSVNYFMPTKTESEWDSFVANKPNNVLVDPIRNGEWSEYVFGSWGSCSASCGGGTQTRTGTRSCTDPSPLNGGNGCVGSTTTSESQSCNTSACSTSWSSGSDGNGGLNNNGPSVTTSGSGNSIGTGSGGTVNSGAANAW